MSVRRALGLLAVVLALAGALALALLAADVLRWQSAIEAGDARFGAVAGTRDMWQPDTLLPGDLTQSLAGVTDDVEFRDAVQRFRFARPRTPVTQFSQLAARGAADRALARVGRGGQPSLDGSRRQLKGRVGSGERLARTGGAAAAPRDHALPRRCRDRRAATAPTSLKSSWRCAAEGRVELGRRGSAGPPAPGGRATSGSGY